MSRPAILVMARVADDWLIGDELDAGELEFDLDLASCFGHGEEKEAGQRESQHAVTYYNWLHKKIARVLVQSLRRVDDVVPSCPVCAARPLPPKLRPRGA